MKLNSIVLYKGRPAIIKNLSDGKFEIETELGIKKVREKDFYVLSENNTQNLKTIINANCESADFSEISVFFEEGYASFFDIVELAWNNLPTEQIWVAWQAVCSSPILCAETPDKPIRIRSKQEVDLIIKKQNEKASQEKDRQYFLEDLSNALKTKNFLEFDVKKYSHFLQEVEAFALEKTDKAKILKDLHLKEQPEVAHKLLIQSGYWHIEKNPYPTRFGHPLNSPKIELPPLDINHRYLDLTHITAYAIDNAESNDPDDAICFDGEFLWIHIANPADTISPDSKSDLEARKRGATLYIPEGASRMLGESAIENFALGINEESYALSFKLKLNENSEITEVNVLRTKIKVKCLTYSDADLQKDSKELKPLFEIAERSKNKREQFGAISIDMPEVNISVKNEDNIQKVYIAEHQQSSSFLMIKEMMLLAGEGVARFAFKNNIPFQFISQETPDIPQKLPAGLAGEYRKRKAMRPRSVGTIPAVHAALGIAMYSQVTSPLRRYGDLVAHQQLLKFIDGKELMKTDDFLMRIVAGDIAGRNCIQAERASKQHWTLIYLLQNPNWKGEAVILDVIKLRARILIPELAYETEMQLKKELSINEKILVVAKDIDIPNLTVRFEQI